jgi:hypothetical protein
LNPGNVHPAEWAASACGAVILAGLFLPWHGDTAGLDEVGVLDVLLAVAGIVALLLPVLLAASRTTNLPIVTETMLSTAAVILSLVLLVKLLWAPDDGWKAGFYLGLAGTALLAITGWKSVARET